MKARAINGGILSPRASTAARDLGYRALVHIPDLQGKAEIHRNIAREGTIGIVYLSGFTCQPLS
jgi:hypothetical protein